MIGPSHQLRGPSGVRCGPEPWVHVYLRGCPIASCSLASVQGHSLGRIEGARRVALSLVAQWWGPVLAEKLSQIQIEVDE